MATIGPFEVGYPVNFKSGGDTTREAFGKHIQEFLKLYGNLNAVNADKVSASELTEKLTEHKNSTNPHPNWKPSLSYGDISGTVDASKVSGTLSNANIDASRVYRLSEFVNGMLPEDKGDGITSSHLVSGEPGYVKFKNGLMLQWGYFDLGADVSEGEHDVILSWSYQTAILNVQLTMELKTGNTQCNVVAHLLKDKYQLNRFTYYLELYGSSYDVAGAANNLRVRYLVIGV